ncbi:MAG: hypothetical protein ACFFD2_26980, partial [Promethearchaeota archaeon]
MEKRVKIFKRLPSDAGITFEGFEKVKIESRTIVKEKFDRYFNIIQTEKNPSLRMIVGEWGEGKTDAYERYIKTKVEELNYRSLFVSASTISNSYELST